MTTKTDHEHEWEYVQQQVVYEGFAIESIEYEGDADDPGRTAFFKPADDPSWGNVDSVIDNAVRCSKCDAEFPYPEGGWEVTWY